MKELFALTENRVIGSLIEKVMTDKGVSRFGARLLVLNALVYEHVQDAIMEEIDYLMEDDENEQSQEDETEEGNESEAAGRGIRREHQNGAVL